MAATISILHKSGHGLVFTPSLSSVLTVAASFFVYLDFNSDDNLLNSSRLRASSSIFINSGTPATISFLSHL
jgi:hypothetical protein